MARHIITLVACAFTPPLGSSAALAFNPLAIVDRRQQAGMRISHSQLGTSARDGNDGADNDHSIVNQLAAHNSISGDFFRFEADSGPQPERRRRDGTQRNSDSDVTQQHHPSSRILDKRRKHWINRSLKYYTTVAREQKRRNRGQLSPSFPRSSPDELSRQISMAERHYFARSLIKSGKFDHAESLYRRSIREIQADEDGCDHARLAVSTLLLALLKQRMNDVKGTRSVFLNFFRTVLLEYDDDKECACSAKVLQAYALFEMKRGHGRKSLEIVERAVALDEDLRPVLAWKQFRSVMDEAATAAAAAE